MDMPPLLHDGDWLLLNVKARPAAKVDRLKGVSGGLVQVDVAAKAEDGKATERLLGFLARQFGVSRTEIELVSGAHARWKRIRVWKPASIPEILAVHIPPGNH